MESQIGSPQNRMARVHKYAISQESLSRFVRDYAQAMHTTPLSERGTKFQEKKHKFLRELIYFLSDERKMRDGGAVVDILKKSFISKNEVCKQSPWRWESVVLHLDLHLNSVHWHFYDNDHHF